MAMVYVAVAVLFVVNPDWPILMVNKAFAGFNWPVTFFPTERFWHSLAVGVPGTRAFLAFTAAQNPAQGRLCIKALQVSLLLAGLLFARHFLFYRPAPIYALGFLTELIQVGLYLFIYRRLP
jgi:hypothetical protein